MESINKKITMNKEQSIQAAADHNLITTFPHIHTIQTNSLYSCMEKKTINYKGFNLTVGTDGNLYKQNGEPAKLQKNTSGYLTRNRENKVILIHRVIALAFIPNPENKPMVNHKSGNKSDNSISNLEWVTKVENERHSIDVLGNKRNVSGLLKWIKEHGNRKKITALNIATSEKIDFISGKEAAIYLKCSQTYVSAAIKNQFAIKGHLLVHS
mgnify:FL=1